MSIANWFGTAKFGLFIHWDHASQQGYEISWPLLGQGLNGYFDDSDAAPSAAAYHASAETFDPDQWDPTRLAAIAKAAGMRYAVFTTKHHSGWTAWPSSSAPFTIATSPYGQRGGDLVREFADAFREAGLRIGLYYSLCDWSHPDYPAWTDDKKPYRRRIEITSPAQWARFREAMKSQLGELLTKYGPIDLLWFDGQWERTPDEWGSDDLRAHINALAPDVIINDRLPSAGDYATPEQFIPPRGYSDPWEACITMSDNWGYVPTDLNYKSPAVLLRTLVEVVARGGNLLLNVGPRGDGSLPEQESDLLAAISDWMSIHAESVHDTERGVEPWQFYGPSTRRGNCIYLHLVGWPEESTSVRGIDPHQVRAVTLLTTGDKLAYHGLPAGRGELGELVIELPPSRPATPLPVIKVEIDE